MARTWKQERTTPKQQPRKATQRPRMNEFAAKWYEDHGYTVTPLCEDQVRPYLEADDND